MHDHPVHEQESERMLSWVSVIVGIGLLLGGAAGTLLTAKSRPARAELPPYVYADLQAEAPEVLTIHVEAVRTTGSGSVTTIIVEAVVVTVERSTAGLRSGDRLSIGYEREQHADGWTGPSPVPLLRQGTETLAFLAPATGNDASAFRPAAGGWSFGPRADSW